MTSASIESQKMLNSVLLREKIALRSLIFYEFVGRKDNDRYSAYKKMCDVIGYEIVSFLEFDFWFSRFENDNFDLNVDERQIPKEGRLAVMPIHIFDKILEDLKLPDMFRLRMVNRNLRSIIDQKIHCKDVELLLDDVNFTMKVDGEVVESHNHKRRCNKLALLDFMTKSLRRFHLLLNMRLDHLRIEFNGSDKRTNDLFLGKIHGTFLSKNSSMSIKSIDLGVQKEEHFMKIIPYLRPGTLESILIRRGGCYKSQDPLEMDRLCETEQWKRAKSGYIYIYQRDFDHYNIYHLENFHIYGIISAEGVLDLKDELLLSKVFKKGTLDLDCDYYDYDLVEADRYIDFPEVPRDPENPENRHYQFKDSTDFLEIEVTDTTFRFERVL